jgi:putative oxidoreductase
MRKEVLLKPILRRFHEHTYALLRIFSGAMFMIHGTGKILGWPESKMQPAVGSLLWVSGIIELVCGALILVGFLSTIAALIASGEMAVAYFVAHAPHGFIPNVNKGEPAVLYCFIFLYIAANGGGVWSIDKAVFGRSAASATATVP